MSSFLRFAGLHNLHLQQLRLLFPILYSQFLYHVKYLWSTFACTAIGFAFQNDVLLSFFAHQLCD